MNTYTCIAYVISVLSGSFSVLPVIDTVTCNTEMINESFIWRIKDAQTTNSLIFIIPSYYNNQNLEFILKITLIPPSHPSDVKTFYFEHKENIFSLRPGFRCIYYNVFKILILQ